MEKYYKVADIENIISKLRSTPQYPLSTCDNFDKDRDSLIKKMFEDIAEAPTGGVDENFEIRPFKDQVSYSLIRILAGHLVANGWIKEDKK